MIIYMRTYPSCVYYTKDKHKLNELHSIQTKLIASKGNTKCQNANYCKKRGYVYVPYNHSKIM